MTSDRTTPWRAFLLLGLAALYVCLALSNLTDVNWLSAASPAVQAYARKWQTVGLGVFVAAALGCILSGMTNGGRLNGRALIVWAPVLAWMVASTGWSIKPEASALYSGYLIVILAASTIYWLMPERYSRMAANFAMIAIGAGMVILFSRLPIHARNLGGVAPTLLGHFGFAAIVLAYLGGKRFRLIGLGLGAALLVFSQARTALVGTAAFLAVYHLLMPRIRDRGSLVVTTSLGVFAAVLMALFAPLLIQLMQDTVNGLLGISDGVRGSGSGFSGRTSLWAGAIDLIQQRPMTGYGFRSRGGLVAAIEGAAVNGHSGVLNAVLDIGFVGAALLGAAYLAMIGFLLVAYTEAKSDADRVAASFLLGFVPVLAAEPNYLNFASPASFLMIVCLASPIAVRVNRENEPARVAAILGRSALARSVRAS